MNITVYPQLVTSICRLSGNKFVVSKTCSRFNGKCNIRIAFYDRTYKKKNILFGGKALSHPSKGFASVLYVLNYAYHFFNSSFSLRFFQTILSPQNGQPRMSHLETLEAKVIVYFVMDFFVFRP